MPEYSSTPITPADSVKTPAMNGSTSGNYELSALRDYILASKGLANGLASLDANGKLPTSQLPDLADDVLVYGSYALLPSPGTAGKLYITADDNKMYRWDDTLSTPDYVELSVDLSDYATKAEVADAVEDLEAANTDLKNAIQDSEQRIENLEQAVSGSLVQTNVLTDPPSMANVRTITNANTILPWALLNRVGARATQWNQAVKTLRASGTIAGITFTNNGDGSITLSGTPSAYAIAIAIDATSIPVGHKLLVIGGTSTARLRGASSLAYADCDQGNGIIITAQIDTEAYVAVQFQNTTTPVSATLKPQVFDLTAMNEASLTADQFKAKFPASYYPYNAGQIINLNPSGFKVVGFNKFDISTKEDNKCFAWVDGTTTSETNSIASDFIEITEGTQYYCNYVAQWLYYDRDKHFVTSNGPAVETSNVTVPTGKNIKYLRVGLRTSSNGNANMTAKSDINVNIYRASTEPSPHNGDYRPYQNTTLDTSFTSDYKYVNENCHDYSENVLVNGVMRREEHRVCGEISSADTSIWSGWTYEPTSQTFRLEYSDIKCGNNNIRIAGYTVKPYYAGSSEMDDMQVKLHDTNLVHRIYVKNTNYNQSTIEQFKASLGKIYYQKDAEVVNTTSDPIPNIPSEDGTTVTAVTPQTDLVNAIDVPTTIAYMTKIGA